ncbi:hypothetical protein [Simplicispira metamorpha]|uniref:Beta-galactosidase-like protein n=1 Tax=Simplicispira metamorpha TaxID=80881 RepID=A0A4R2MRR1_9BURK|nr:hypothetical protein [Simplicispira metamorpha]TCP11641.1 hypothetical protein EV674_14213 [Simplicispira metamorpha]
MTRRSARHTPTTIATAVAACAALVAGAGGLALLAKHHSTPPKHTGPMLLAPMFGTFDTCIATPTATPSAGVGNAATARTQDGARTLAETCTGPNGSAAALVESTLSALQPPERAQGPYPLGYTLAVPLLQLFRATEQGWALDTERIQRLARTVRDTQRPLILYLFSTHFATDAPLEKALATDPANLAQTRDGPMPTSQYYGAPLYNWTLARTDTPLSAYRVQATQALLTEMCRLPAQDIAKIRGVTLLGELHHLFPDFESGMGFGGSYRVTDYSPASVAGFQQFLRQEFQHIDRLNRRLGANYATFTEVQPPSRDIRTEPLQRYTEHIDSFAHGSLPIAGWAFAPRPAGAPPAWVHVYRNGTFIGKTPVNKGRQDVLQAKPELGDANTGWRLDMDFKRLPVGLHRIDVFLEARPGRLQALGTRRIAIMDDRQRPPAPLAQQALPASAPPDAALQAHIDWPAEQSSYYYNPLVPLWHSFRGQQVVDYLQFFQGVVKQSCLAGTPHYTHQIIPFTNPSWDENKFAIQVSLRALPGMRLGVSLYGDATYGTAFSQWYASTGHPGYGVTEFHPLKAMNAPALQHTLNQHAARGAQFLSFFLEPHWQGQLVARDANMFSLSPENAPFGSAQLYQSAQRLLTTARQ